MTKKREARCGQTQRASITQTDAFEHNATDAARQQILWLTRRLRVGPAVAGVIAELAFSKVERAR
jgi:hypothetical protein